MYRSPLPALNQGFLNAVASSYKNFAELTNSNKWFKGLDYAAGEAKPQKILLVED